MYTFVFEDNVQINDFENGIQIKFFLNDTLYQIETVKSALKQNFGDLFVLPDSTGVGIKSARMSDLSYYNYALNPNQISQRFNKGPSSNIFTKTKTDTFGTPLYMSASNKIDQTNF
jgi:hypothetical protein